MSELAIRARKGIGRIPFSSLFSVFILCSYFVSPLNAVVKTERGWEFGINVSGISKNHDDDRIFFGLQASRHTQSKISFGFEVSGNFADVNTFGFVEYVHLQNYFGGYLNYLLLTRANTSVRFGAALGYAFTDIQEVDGDVSGSGPRSSTYIEPRVTIEMPKFNGFARPVVTIGYYSILNTGIDQDFNVAKVTAGLLF